MKIFHILLIFLLVYSIFYTLFIFPISTLGPDEGTHLLISLFYYDTVHFVLKNGFQNVYSFAIDYLTHYPKLSVYYPPLYHILTSLAFNFTISETIGRLITFVFSLASVFLTYKIGSMLFNENVGLLSSILLATSPVVIKYGREVLLDIPLFFFFMLTLWFYLMAFKEKKFKYFVFASISLALGYLTKWLILAITPVLFSYLIIKKRRDTKIIRNYIISLVIASLILLPYLLFYYKFGLAQLMYKGTIIGGILAGRPQATTIEGWLFYPNVLIEQLSPVVALLGLVSFLFFVWKKEKNWELILIWIILVYIIFSVSPNKNERYTIMYLPAFLFSSTYLFNKHFSKTKIYLPFFVLLIISQIFFSYQYLPKNNLPIEEISEFIYNNSKGNVAFASERGDIYPSSFMFYLSKLDRNRNISVYRACAFENKTQSQVMKLLDDYGIEYVIFIKNPESGTIENFVNLSLVKEFDSTKVFTYNGFDKKPERTCNYICLTKTTICSDFVK